MESSFEPSAKPLKCPPGRKCSARGLFQITEDTAGDAGYDHSIISDPSSQKNIEYGIKAGIYVLYQKTYWDWYGKGNIKKGLMWYHGDTPSVNEAYANRILKCEKCLKNNPCCVKKCLGELHN
jgi:soluble lytic murein transglycosylase-like protein